MKRIVVWIGVCIFIIMNSFSVADKSTENDAPRPLEELSAAEQSSEIPEVIKSESYVGEVSFKHQEHFDDLEIECETCHHEVNAAKLNFPHENYFEDFWIDCLICHHESGLKTQPAQACSNCHHTLPENIADETLSSKVVIHKNCWECHEASKGQEASKNCVFCHTGPKLNF